MEKPENKPTASPGEDRISELPAEILHDILRRLEHPRKAGQTIALSRQWRKVWHSYPVVDFDPSQVESREDFQKFSDSRIERFSRDSLLRMESLKLKPCVYEDSWIVCSPYPVVEPLLDLALERKAEDVQIICAYSIHLPNRLLFNSTVKSLRLSRIAFAFDNDFNDTRSCLRFLHLSNVRFEDRELLTRLIEKSPRLETLKLFGLGEMRKLQVSKVANLKELEIQDSDDVLQEIGIVAPRLESLICIGDTNLVLDLKIEIAAPLLISLEIPGARFTERDIEAMISKLPCLKYLTINEYRHIEMKLKLSSSGLVEFKLCAPSGLEEIELDAGPGLEKFSIRYEKCSIHELKKCEISNAGASFRSEVWYSFYSHLRSNQIDKWLVGFKRLMRLSHFHTIIINWKHDYGWEYKNKSEEVESNIHRGSIQHLKIETVSWYFPEATALMNFLLGACKPEILTIPSPYRWYDKMSPYRSYDYKWQRYFRLQEFHGRFNWRRQLKLKNVKIEEGKYQTCFSLPWSKR